MPIDYTAHLRSDGEKMALAVARDLDAHVPTCPDWNVAKLTIHTGQHHRWVADSVRGGGEPPANPSKPGLRGDELVEWFRQGWRDLADLLDASDDETTAWSWSGDNRVGFWRRRTALETLVHRWDAENAVGGASDLDPALAADGVDEMVFVMIPHGDGGYKGVPMQVALETTDTPGAWTLELEGGKPMRTERGAATGAVVVVVGSAENLLLFLWGRRGPEAVEISGEPDLVAAFLEWMDE
jgi:uncharacterized protein (TIGR03083 family)